MFAPYKNKLLLVVRLFFDRIILMALLTLKFGYFCNKMFHWVFPVVYEPFAAETDVKSAYNENCE